MLQKYEIFTTIMALHNVCVWDTHKYVYLQCYDDNGYISLKYSSYIVNITFFQCIIYSTNNIKH